MCAHGGPGWAPPTPDRGGGRTLDEAEVAGQELVKLVGDHHAANVQLQVVLLLVIVLVEVVRRLLGDEEDALELNLALGGEVRVRERLAEVLD